MEFIGSGDYAKVYRSRNKVYKITTSESDYLNSIKQSLMNLSNIVKIYSHKELPNGKFLIVSEYLNKLDINYVDKLEEHLVFTNLSRIGYLLDPNTVDDLDLFGKVDKDNIKKVVYDSINLGMRRIDLKINNLGIKGGVIKLLDLGS